jgi:hypothetical protein
VLVDTRSLKKELPTLDPAFNGRQPPRVYHVEGGITIHELYTNLNNKVPPLALETMGGASGQTLAGAISTGTHGGDLFMPPIADSVLAIHLVAAGGIQYWIEPTAAITDKALLRQFVVPDIAPEHIVYDDKWFNAVLVSMGCMGIIYAVVLRVRPRYNLIETTIATTWQSFKQNVVEQLNDNSARFLQVAVNPYAGDDGNNVALVTTRREGDITGLQLVSPPTGVVKALLTLIGDLLGKDLWQTLKILVDELGKALNDGKFGSATGILVDAINEILRNNAAGLRTVLEKDYSAIMSAAWPPGTVGDVSYRVMDVNRYRPPLGPSDVDSPAVDATGGYSIEMFFPAPSSIAFVDALTNLVKAAANTFVAGYVGIRYMGQTRAFLGMQQWSQTCSVEISTLPGIQGEFALLSDMLDLMHAHGGIPHWGQLLDLNSQGHASIYPNFSKWREVYATLSNNFTARTFENDLSVRWKLTLPNLN